ncbi:MAG: hypothetical protein AB4372_28185 [Xenococcus sp. (in: cyanobacteria)]
MKELILLQGDQLSIDFSEIGFDPDTPQYSICPKCSAQIIKLSSGCGVCGWSQDEKLLVYISAGTQGDKLSIPCEIKEPHKEPVDGLIICARGSEFDVQIDDRIIRVAKIYVFPKLVVPEKRSNLSPSKGPPSKTRRKKGEGSGAIFYRTITKNGKEYQEAYYKWRSGGKQRSKYIPNKLLDKVKQAESRKLPIEDILVLLGCIEKCSRKKSDTFIVSTDDKVIETSEKCSRKNIHPSKKRREKGRGTAYIECKPITKNGKQYKQYWFHWQVWRDGETVIKKSRYIPKKQVSKVMRMNNEKVPVEKILKVLEKKSKRKK